MCKLLKISILIVFTSAILLLGCNTDTNDDPVTSGKTHLILTIQDELPNGNMAPELVVVPNGSNTLGDISGKGLPSERPTYKVSIKKPFAISRYEVTFDEYDLFCDMTNREKPYDENWGRGKRPVINVTWDDAQAYVKWLSQKTGKKYYLPSEAQWEYAARAGTQTNYWWGDEPGDKNAQCGDCAAIHRCEDCKNVPLLDEGTTTVGNFNPNPYGIYDVHGNVMEWTADCGNETNSPQPSNGKPRLTGDCSRRIMKDGSWWNNVRYIRASVRGSAVDGRDYKSKHVGIRVARLINDDS